MIRKISHKRLKIDHNILSREVDPPRQGPERQKLKEQHAQIANIVGSVVAHSLQVPPAEMFAQTRCRASTALARQIAIYLLHTGVGLSLNQVAPLFKRDRTTVAHACRKVEELRDDQHIDTLLGHLERSLDALRPVVFAEEARS
jgi:chromosomal replication initiation ATPase DnaA